VSRSWRPASRAAAGDFDYASDRDGDGVPAGGNRGSGALCPRTENVFAHGWGADLKRRGGAATDSASSDARFGSGCALVRRDQERTNGRGGGGVLSSGTGGGFFVCAQAGDAVGVEDALHVGADGGAAGAGSEEDSASQDCVSRGGERGVCADSAGGNSEDTGPVLLLRLERRGVGGAMDVLIRHDRRGRPGVCRVCGGSGEGPHELKPPRLSTKSRRTYFLAALTFAHRALCAAAILLRPAAEIVRFLRIATGRRLLPCRKTFPKVVRAAVT